MSSTKAMDLIISEQRNQDASNRVEKILSRDIIKAKNRKETAAFRTQALGEKIPVYYFAESVSEQDRMFVFTIMVMIGRTSDSDNTKWQTYFLTFCCLIFPEMVGMMKRNGSVKSYAFEPLSSEFISKCRAYVIDGMQVEDPKAHFIELVSTLPDVSDVPFNPHLPGACTLEGIYTYWSMMMFIAGKPISPENADAISTKRPKALMDKRGLAASELILLGDYKLPTRNYEKIKRVWARSSGPRVVIVEHHVMLCAHDTPEELENLVVTMNLLKNTNQTYITHITNLLSSCWYVVTLEACRSDFRNYEKQIAYLDSLDPLMMPYHKFAYQDKSPCIQRNGLDNLIACATFHATQTKRTMDQYRINENSFPVLEQFQKLAARHGYHMTMSENQQTTDNAI